MHKKALARPTAPGHWWTCTMQLPADLNSSLRLYSAAKGTTSCHWRTPALHETTMTETPRFRIRALRWPGMHKKALTRPTSAAHVSLHAPGHWWTCTMQLPANLNSGLRLYSAAKGTTSCHWRTPALHETTMTETPQFRICALRWPGMHYPC